MEEYAADDDLEEYIYAVGKVLITTFLKADMGLKSYLQELLHKKT